MLAKLILFFLNLQINPTLDLLCRKNCNSVDDKQGTPSEFTYKYLTKMIDEFLPFNFPNPYISTIDHLNGKSYSY